ncbi:GTPase [Parasporobacterium paucivorans]|uniref:Uncharacterized conserved protein, DUF697 family n=1 Tax=Parasporobacterium paucivorans DSM 15970 TaxID=1122934 RepID=A0A1M6GTF8_9FIRM|nr:GTPase [Parasporobacterium paucivorans]SHJ13187.1 Uncharacterized conserved protein, DUF697 family [Parasporobacterium paucivorans DSM 15970]
MNIKANVLVVGNSGVGKSTLINTVFDFERAAVGEGSTITRKMAIYETGKTNFRLIDTRGLEYGWRAQIQTKNALSKWSKDSVKKNEEEKYIHIIWYCIDATSKRVFSKNLDLLKNVARLWKNIPIIIVLTKSYSEKELEENFRMVKISLEKYKTQHLHIVGIIPVVAKPFAVNEEIIIPPVGVDHLIERTNEIIPEAFRINEKSVRELSLRIKRTNANSLTIAATSGAAVIGAVPIPVADSLILMPLQSGLVIGISKIYGLNKKDRNSNNITNAIISSGAVTLGARTVISGLKAIPGLNIAAALINSVVAAVITAVIGEITIKIMEKMQKGEVQPENLEWIRKFAESEFLSRTGKYVGKLGKSLEGKDPKHVGKVISEIFKKGV